MVISGITLIQYHNQEIDFGAIYQLYVYFTSFTRSVSVYVHALSSVKFAHMYIRADKSSQDTEV